MNIPLVSNFNNVDCQNVDDMQHQMDRYIQRKPLYNCLFCHHFLCLVILST